MTAPIINGMERAAMGAMESTAMGRAATQMFQKTLKAGGEMFGNVAKKAAQEFPNAARFVENMTPQHAEATGKVLDRLSPLMGNPMVRAPPPPPMMTHAGSPGQGASMMKSGMDYMSSFLTGGNAVAGRSVGVTNLPTAVTNPLKAMFDAVGGGEAVERGGQNWGMGFGNKMGQTAVKVTQEFFKFAMEAEKTMMRNAQLRGEAYQRTPNMMKQIMKEANAEMKNKGVYKEAYKEMRTEAKGQLQKAVKKEVKEQLSEKSDEWGQNLSDQLHEFAKNSFSDRAMRDVDPNLRKLAKEMEETQQARVEQGTEAHTEKAMARPKPQRTESHTDAFRELADANREIQSQMRLAQSMALLGGDMGRYQEVLKNNHKEKKEPVAAEANHTEAKHSAADGGTQPAADGGNQPAASAVERSEGLMAKVAKSNAGVNLAAIAMGAHMLPMTYSTMFLHAAVLGMMMNEGHYNPDETNTQNTAPNGTPAPNTANQTQTPDMSKMEEVD